MAIFDLNGNEQIRYGTRVIVSEDTIRGLRIDSIFLSSYGLDSAMYTIEHEGGLLTLTQQTAAGVTSVTGDVSPDASTAVVGSATISWTVTSDIGALMDGRITAHVARPAGDYLGGTTQAVGEHSYRKITTNSAQNIATANCSWRRPGEGAWKTGTITDVTPGETLEIRTNTYPTPGRKWLSLLQGNHRYQSAVTVIDPAAANNTSYDVRIGTGDSWDDWQGVTGTFDEDITLTGLDTDEPLCIWIRGTALETFAQSYQQLHDRTFTLVDGRVYPPPEIVELSTTDGELLVSITHPYDGYKMLVLRYRGTERRLMHTGTPLTVNMSVVPYGFSHELTAYASAEGYTSATITEPVSGYWQPSLDPVEHTQIGAGTTVEGVSPLVATQSYLGGRVVVAVDNTAGSITFDGVPIATGNALNVTVPALVEDASVMEDVVDETDGAFGITGNTLYLLNVDGAPVGKWDGTTLAVAGLIDQHHVPIPLAGVATYATEAAHLFFRDHRHWWLQLGRDRVVVHGLVNEEPVSTLDDFVVSRFSISQQGDMVLWELDGEAVLTADLAERTLTAPHSIRILAAGSGASFPELPWFSYSVAAQQYLIAFRDTARQLPSGAHPSFLEFIKDNGLPPLRMRMPLYSYIHAGTDDTPTTAHRSLVTVDDSGMILFNAKYQGEIMTYMALSQDSQNRTVLRTPFALVFGEE